MINEKKLLNILHLFNDGFLVSLPLLLPFVQIELGLNLAQVGFLGTVLKSLSILLAIPAGLIASKYGGTKSLIVAMLIYSCGFILTAIAPSYFFIILAFLFAGLGFGIFHPIAFAEVSKHTSKENRGNAMGNFTAIGDVGRVAISSLITVIASLIGWRLTSGIYGGFAFALFAILILIINKSNSHKVTINNKKISFKVLLKHPKFLKISLTGILDSYASSSLFVFIPFLLLDRGIAPAILGLFTAFFFIGNFLGKTMLGKSVDKYGNVKVFVIAEILMAVTILLFTQLDNLVILSIIAIFLGALTKGTTPVIQTMVADVTENENSFEEVFALNSFIVSIASTTAPLALGLIANSYGINYVFIFSAIFAILAAISSLNLTKL